MTLDEAKEIVKKAASTESDTILHAICKLLESHIELTLSEKTLKLKLLEENNYEYSTRYSVYYNKETKRVFSTEYLKANTSDQVEKDMKEPQVYFIGPVSTDMLDELRALLRE